MSGPVPPFAAESPAGRTLIALRAGAMSSAELYERFAGNHALAELHKRGFVEQCIAGGWKLTAAGREACPLRNPLAGGLPPDPPEPAPMAASFCEVLVTAISASCRAWRACR